MKMKIFSYPYMLWLAIFIVVPLILVLLYAVTVTEGGSITFTIENLRRFLDPNYIDVLWISIKLALETTVITLILGYPIGMIIAKEKPSRRNTMILLFVIPMWMNFLLRTYASLPY